MDDMVGEWKLETRDNKVFGDFLACRGVHWFLRQMMTTGKADVEYKLSEDRATFTKFTKTVFKTGEYPMPTEGDFCPLKTLSGKQEVGRLMETSAGNVVLKMDYVDTGKKTILYICYVNNLEMTL